MTMHNRTVALSLALLLAIGVAVSLSREGPPKYVWKNQNLDRFSEPPGGPPVDGYRVLASSGIGTWRCFDLVAWRPPSRIEEFLWSLRVLPRRAWDKFDAAEYDPETSTVVRDASGEQWMRCVRV